MSARCEIGGKQAAGAPMNLFERWLTLWVALCILAGIGLGRFFPAPFQFLGRMEVAQVNLPLGTLELDALRQMANPARVQPSSAEQDTDCPLPGGEACRRGHVSARCWCQCRQASTSRVAASSGSTKMPITAL